MATPQHLTAKIIITFSKDRSKPGALWVYGPYGRHLATFECLGKADNARAKRANNPERDPVFPYGDTPSGDYEATHMVKLPEELQEKFGEFYLPLKGAFGDALRAAEMGKRTGLAIHGGRGDLKLIPTYGCVRLRDCDMKSLAKLCKNQTFRVEIREEE